MSSKYMIRTFGLFIGILIVVGLALGGSLYWDAFVVEPEEGAEPVEFVVEAGASVEQIAAALEEQEFVTSAGFFKIFVRLTGNQSNLQAGVFELVPGSSFQILIAELTHAEAAETQVTIPEGYTLSQIGEVMIEAFEEVTEEDWTEVSGENGKWMISSSDLLTGIPKGYGLEGYLFPDTYRFRNDVNAETIASTMVLTLKRRMAENEIVIPSTLVFENGMTLHEILTLASIVEREVASVEDMGIVAGIFLTRLQIGMALQADSTVNYITGKKDAAISLEDSKIDSAYNTYLYLGLPPGPISNPGINAIMAVLSPTDSEYLYFLTSTEGEAIFARTFDQHIANKYQYLK